MKNLSFIEINKKPLASRRMFGGEREEERDW